MLISRERPFRIGDLHRMIWRRWRLAGSPALFFIFLMLTVSTLFPLVRAAGPTVSLTGPVPTPTTVGTPANFTATASGGSGIFSFHWNFGDDAVILDGGPRNPNWQLHTFTLTGTYTVKVNATDDTNALASDSLVVTVIPAPLKIVASDVNVEIGNAAALQASASGGTAPYSFSWNFGDNTGNLDGGTSNPNVQSHTYTAVGTYNVRVNVTDSASKLASAAPTVHILSLSILGLDCAYGSNLEGAPFPTSITGSYPYSGPDFDGTLDTSCQATYLADTDATLHPLVSDNPTAIVAVGAGGGFTVDVVARLNSIRTINGFDISLSYDTRVLDAVIIDQSGLIWDGKSLPPGAIILNLAKNIDHSNGVVRVAQVLIGVPQQSDDAELFRVRFDIIAASTGTPLALVADTLTNPGNVPHITSAPSSIDTTAIYNTLASTTLNAVANFTYSPSPPVPGSLLTFTAMASCPGCTGALSYSWDFSSNDDPTYVPKSQATTNSAAITAPAPVANRVTVTISDTAGHSFAITRLLPLVLKEIPPSTTLTLGTAGGSWTGQWLGGVTTSTSGYTGTWVFCPGTALAKTVCSNPIQAISQSGASITQTTSVSAITYNYAGLYNATLKIADTPELQIGTLPSGNTIVASFLVNVTGTTPAYTVILGADNTSPGIGQTVTFSVHTKYDSHYQFPARSFNYVFNFGDGSPSEAVPFSVLIGQNGTLTHAFSSAGKFTVKVVAQETGSGVVSQIEENGFIDVSVGVCLTAGSCDFTFTPTSVVVGSSVTLSATASGGSPPYTFSWDFGDGSTGTGATATHTYKSAGTYSVILTIKDSTGQTQTVTRSVTVAQGGGGSGGGGGFDFVGTLTSPLGLGSIAVAIIAVVGGLIYMMRRGKKPSAS